jgi:hypothetical protein
MKALVTTVSAMLVAFAIQAQEPAKKVAKPASSTTATKSETAITKPAATGEVEPTANPGKPAKPAPVQDGANPNGQTQPTKPADNTAKPTDAAETPKK